MIRLAATPGTLAFLGGSTGTGELLVLFLVVLILFGPRRLPEMARMIGRAMHELRRTAQDFRDQIMRIDPGLGGDPPPKSGTPFSPFTLPRRSTELPPAVSAPPAAVTPEPPPPTPTPPPAQDGSAGG